MKVYGGCAAALALSALALRPGPAGVLLLLMAAAVPVVWLIGRRGLRVPAALSGLDRLLLLRFFVVGCQAVTIFLTRPLWRSRDYPPMLPLVRLPHLDYGWLMLGSLVLVLAWPKVGGWVHLGILALSVLDDQTRLQPEFVSLALLILATTVPRIGTTLGRAHLATLWFWAGVHKLLALNFMIGSARFMYEGLPITIPWLRGSFGWLVAGTELLTGLTMAIRPLRRLGVMLALGLHGMILLVLSPWGQDWNRSVWPWNLALGLAAVALFWPDGREEAEPRRVHLTRLAIVGAAALYPAGFYLGVVDAYLAHHLYSDASALAYCEPAGCRSADFSDTWKAFEVPLPPEPRLFRQYFLAVCEPGETLVQVPRQTKLLLGLNSRQSEVDC